MVVKVKPEQLEEAIRAQLEEYNANVTKGVNRALEEVADKSADELHKGGPYKERTGKYTKSWKVDERTGDIPGITSKRFSVHNRKPQWRLGHLLEYGHATRNGGRAKAYPHIAKVEESAEKWAVEAITKAVREANEA